MQHSAKVILVGFDGATFRLADPLMRAGHMPNLAALIARGCRAALDSTIPWHSAAAWTSMATGVWPGKHGVFNFFMLRPDMRNTPVSSADCTAEKLWRRLNRGGFRTGVVNVPMTYPVEDVDGFMLSGLPGPGTDFRPVEKRQALSKFQFISLASLYSADGYIRDHKRLVTIRLHNDRMRCGIAVGLADMAPDFLMVVFSSTDELQHAMWHSWDPAHPAHKKIDLSWEPAVLPLAYGNVDSCLGELLRAYAGPDTAVFVVSDHGSGPSKHIVFPNRLLAEWGCLQPGGPPPGDPLAADEYYLPAKIGFDPARTRAFMGNALCGPFAEIFINLKGRYPRGIVGPGAEYERLRAELAEKFLAWKDELTGFRPVIKAHRREEIYEGPFTAETADLLLELNDCRSMADVSGYPALFECLPFHVPTKAQTGTHTREGIFAAAGPGIRPGAAFERFNIVDVAPTVLHCFGLPVPDYYDGRALTEIYAPEYIETHPVRVETAPAPRPPGHNGSAAPPISEEEKEKIAETLKGLGYLQ